MTSIMVPTTSLLVAGATSRCGQTTSRTIWLVGSLLTPASTSWWTGYSTGFADESHSYSCSTSLKHPLLWTQQQFSRYYGGWWVQRQLMRTSHACSSPALVITVMFVDSLTWCLLLNLSMTTICSCVRYYTGLAYLVPGDCSSIFPWQQYAHATIYLAPTWQLVWRLHTDLKGQLIRCSQEKYQNLATITLAAVSRKKLKIGKFVIPQTCPLWRLFILLL